MRLLGLQIELLIKESKIQLATRHDTVSSIATPSTLQTPKVILALCRIQKSNTHPRNFREKLEKIKENYPSHTVTLPPRPPRYINFFEPFHFLAGDQLVVPIGASHISLPLQEIQSSEWEKKNKRTKQTTRAGC